MKKLLEQYKSGEIGLEEATKGMSKLDRVIFYISIEEVTKNAFYKSYLLKMLHDVKLEKAQQ